MKSHEKSKNFLWFTTKFEGLLGIHKDNIYSIRIGKEARVVAMDGTEYILHPEHVEEAVHVFNTR